MELEQLLSQIAIWSNREQAIRREKHKRGESFNIFKACGVDHYEVTHSSIIAEFLNPKGSHGQETLFTQAFVEMLAQNDFDFLMNNIKVEKEFVIPDGRIDIIIYNGNNQSIIIENKIYASDQVAQLKRYDDYAKKKYYNGYKILYLTLDGRNPIDEDSQKIDYIPISYQSDIIDWLTRCKHLSIDKPLIRETLNQYIRHIQELTSTIEMETQNKTEILDILIKNHTATIQIMNMQNTLERFIIETKIIPVLKRIADNYNLEFRIDVDTFMAKKPNNGFQMYPKMQTNWHMQFAFDNGGWKNMAVGLTWNDEDTNKEIKRLNMFTGGPNKLWFYGWTYVEERNWDIEYLLNVANNIEEFELYYSNMVENILKSLQTEGFFDFQK